MQRRSRCSRAAGRLAVRRVQAGSQTDLITQRYRNDAANRMTAFTLGIAGQTKSYALSYDANNRLSQIAQTGATTASNPSGNLSASFTYDAFDRRIQSSIAQGSNPAQTVQYLYEGSQVLGEIRDGKLSHRLLTGLSLDETIARIALASNGQKDNAGSRIFMTDALNSVIAQLSDDSASSASAGIIQGGYGYSPYGESVAVGPDSTSTNASTKNPIGYTSRENDQTGLLFYRARYYDPVLKRFISSDPIGLAGGLNTFGYVEGDPLSKTDPTGLVSSVQWCYQSPANAITCNQAGITPKPIRIPPPIVFPDDCNEACKKAIVDATNRYWKLTMKRLP